MSEPKKYSEVPDTLTDDQNLLEHGDGDVSDPSEDLLLEKLIHEGEGAVR